MVSGSIRLLIGKELRFREHCDLMIHAKAGSFKMLLFVAYRTTTPTYASSQVVLAYATAVLFLCSICLTNLQSHCGIEQERCL